MNDHKSGRLGTCPICGKKFTNDDKDVRLALLTFQWSPNTRETECQRIWYRIHEHCATENDDDATIGRQLAGLYSDLTGLNIHDNTRCGAYE